MRVASASCLISQPGSAAVKCSWRRYPGVSTRIRADWLKKEALYYLQVANAQVTLVGDAGVAVTALQLADDKLLEAADPTLDARARRTQP